MADSLFKVWQIHCIGISAQQECMACPQAIHLLFILFLFTKKKRGGGGVKIAMNWHSVEDGFLLCNGNWDTHQLMALLLKLDKPGKFLD